MLQQGRLGEIVDMELEWEDGVSREGVIKMLQVALLCMQNEPQARPTMEEVAGMLGGSGITEKWEKWQVRAFK